MTRSMIFFVVAVSIVFAQHSLAKQKDTRAYLECYVSLREFQERESSDSQFVYAGNTGQLNVNFRAPIKISQKEENAEDLTDLRPEWEARLKKDWKSRLNFSAIVTGGGHFTIIEDVEGLFKFRNNLRDEPVEPQFDKRFGLNKKTGKKELWGAMRFRIFFTAPDSLAGREVHFKVEYKSRKYGDHTTGALPIEIRQANTKEDIEEALGIRVFLYHEHHAPEAFALADSAIAAGLRGWRLLYYGYRAASESNHRPRGLELFDLLYETTGTVVYGENGREDPPWYRDSEKDNYLRWRSDLIYDMVSNGELLLPTHAYTTPESKAWLVDTVHTIMLNACHPEYFDSASWHDSWLKKRQEIVEAETERGLKQRLRDFVRGRGGRMIVEGDPEESWYGGLVRDEVRITDSDSFAVVRVSGYDSSGTLLDTFKTALDSVRKAPRLLLDFSDFRVQALERIGEFLDCISDGTSDTIITEERIYGTDSIVTKSYWLPDQVSFGYSGPIIIYQYHQWPAVAIDYLSKSNKRIKIAQNGSGYNLGASCKRFDICQGIYLLAPTAYSFQTNGSPLSKGGWSWVSERDYYQGAIRKLMAMEP